MFSSSKTSRPNVKELKKSKFNNENYEILEDKSGNRFVKGTGIKQDWQFYATDSTAARDMASYPWTEVTGAAIKTDSRRPTVAVDYEFKDRIPGFVIARYLPIFGSFGSDVANTEVNRAASAYYNYISQGFTANFDYQASDMLMAVVAGANLMSALIEGKRAYGMCNYFDQFNKYYARGAVMALGFDYESLSSNLANFRKSFNQRIENFNKSIKVPADYAYAKRLAFIASNIFSDVSNPTYGSCYLYAAAGHMKYDPVTANTGTCLRWEMKPGRPMTVEEYFAYVDKLFAALNDDDVRGMFGAFSRVYSDDKFIKGTPLDESYATAIVHNDVVSAAFHNMDWVKATSDESAPCNVIGFLPNSYATNGMVRGDIPVYQDGNGDIVPGVYLVNNAIDENEWDKIVEGLTSERHIIDVYDNMNSPEVVLDVTANIMAISPVPSFEYHGKKAYRVACRCEFIYDVQMVTLDNYDEIGFKSFPSLICQGWDYGPVMIPSGCTPFGSICEELTLLSHLDSHPLIKIYSSSVNNSGGEDLTELRFKLIARIGEIDRYTTLSTDDLFSLHETCMWKLSLLPANNKAVTK